jgi:hypothetical protein
MWTANSINELKILIYKKAPSLKHQIGIDKANTVRNKIWIDKTNKQHTKQSVAPGDLTIII